MLSSTPEHSGRHPQKHTCTGGNIVKNLTRIISFPLVSAGILAGTLGLTGTAGAAVSTAGTNGSHSIAAPPDKHGNNPTLNSWKQRHRHEHNNYWRH